MATPVHRLTMMETVLLWESNPEHYDTMASRMFHIPLEEVGVAERHEARNAMLTLLHMDPQWMPQA